MRLLTKTLFFAAISTNISSCWSSDSVDSDKVSSDTYHIDYAVDYDAATKRSTAQAQFRVGGPSGTTVRLAKPSEVSVNGQGMNLKDGDKAAFNVLGSYYQLERLPKKDAYDFAFIDNDSHIRRDTARIPGPVSVNDPKEGDTLDITNDLVIRIDAADLEDNERLEVTLSGIEMFEGKKTPALLTASIRNNDEATFKAKDLKKFITDEPASITVRRVRTEKVVDRHSGQTASITTSFQAKPIAVELN